ncbi:hypothetical protein [Kingella oralis]|nr:hypothetical protein [Kingella oralis]
MPSRCRFQAALICHPRHHASNPVNKGSLKSQIPVQFHSTQTSSPIP